MAIYYKNLKLVADNEHMTEKTMKRLYIEECVKIASLISKPVRHALAKNRIPADKRGVKLPRDVPVRSCQLL